MLIVLAADLSTGSRSRSLALATYKALKSVKEYNVQFLKINDQTTLLADYKLPSIAINDVKHAVIIAFREIKAYMSIDRTNTLVYLATYDVIESFMAFMIHRVDCIMATNYKSAYKLCAAVQQLNLQIPVYRFSQWIDPAECKMNELSDKLRIILKGDINVFRALPSSLIEATHIGTENIVGWTTVDSVVDWSKYDIYICLEDNEVSVRRAMMSGVIPITLNKLPYPEFIINGVNGYIIDNANDALLSINKMLDRTERDVVRMMVVRGAYAQSAAILWAKQFVNTVNGGGAENLHEENLFSSLKPTFRRWIVPKTILDGGKQVQIPRHYNKSHFQVVELHNLEEILLYFSAQRFMDVFIFAWEYGEYNADNYNRIMNLARAVGRRGLSMYWCTDKPIPNEWSEVFKSMTVLPVDQGLKNVRPPMPTVIR